MYAVQTENHALTNRVQELENLVGSLVSDIHSLHRRAQTHEVVLTIILKQFEAQNFFSFEEIQALIDEAEVVSQNEASR